MTRGLRMIDCQMATPHLLSLGAQLIPRPSFIEMLAVHVGRRTAAGALVGCHARIH